MNFKEIYTKCIQAYGHWPDIDKNVKFAILSKWIKTITKYNFLSSNVDIIIYVCVFIIACYHGINAVDFYGDNIIHCNRFVGDFSFNLY